MEVRSQRSSIRTTDTAPQTLPPAASTLPSLRPEKRKCVAQSDLRPLSKWGPNCCFSFGESLPAQAPAWHLFRGCCPAPVVKLVAGFDNVSSLLVGTTSLLSPRISAGSVPMLGLDVFGAVLCPSCASWTKCRASETIPRWSNVWGQKPLPQHIRSGNLHTRPVSHPLSSHVWRTSPICLLERHHHSHSIIFHQCVFETPWRPRSKLIA